MTHGPELADRLSWPSEASLLRQLGRDGFGPTADERKEKLSYSI
jgi:hypothetical protein